MKKYKSQYIELEKILSKNSDLFSIFEKICLEWTDGKANNFQEAYKYLENSDSEKLIEFISYLKEFIRLSYLGR